MASITRTLGSAVALLWARRITRRALRARLAAGRDLAEGVAGEGTRRVHEAIDTVGPTLRRVIDDAELQATLRQIVQPGVAAVTALAPNRRTSRRRRRLLICGLIAGAVAATAAVLVVRARRSSLRRPMPEGTAAPSDPAAPTA